MSELENKADLTIDATSWSIDQLLAQLSTIGTDNKVRFTGISDALSGVLAGFDQSLEVVLASNIGFYALMAARQAAVEIIGNAGMGCGHSLQSGSILIRGDAGNYLASYAAGGYIAVHGRAADYAGYGLAGADVLVRSRCGNGAGAMMTAGTLVLGNGCGESLGYGLTGGAIYVRGEIGSVADSVQAGRLQEKDTIRLSLMLVRAGIKTTCEKFQVFRAKGDKGN